MYPIGEDHKFVSVFSTIECRFLSRVEGKLSGVVFFFVQLTTPEKTITYHNALCLSPQNFA